MKSQYSASVLTFSTSELDSKVPVGSLRSKFAPIEIMDEEGNTTSIADPTWRQMIEHCNPNILASTKTYQGNEFICFPAVFSDLSGETKAIYDWGSGLAQPERTKFTYKEFEEFNWDEKKEIEL